VTTMLAILISPATWAILSLALALSAALVLAFLLGRRILSDRRRLAAAEREKALILDGISDRVTYLDGELRVAWSNWGDAPDGPRPGHVCHEIIAGRETPCPGCPAAEALRTGKPSEGVVSCDDGRVLRMSATAVRDEQDRIVGVVQTSRDITEKRLVADRLKQAQKTEAVGRLAAGVAHDFNNSLQVLLGYAEMLRDESPTDVPARGYLDAMLRAGSQARDVVRHLLAFSRKQEPCCEEIDLADVLRNEVDAIERLMGERVAVRLEAPADLPRIAADPAQLEQVLLNLCLNARDAMPEGGSITVTLEAAELDATEALRRGAPGAGSYVVLGVHDDGEGIDPEIRDRIFDPFFTTKEVDRGSGLGLATVQGIVSAHRGFIEVQSKLRRGTSFRIGWPVTRADRAPRAAGVAGPVNTAPAVSGRILVVEDSAPVRRLAVAVLERRGLTVETASDGREALDRLLREGDRFDVVVMDVMLPGINGWSVYTRASARHPGLRVVFCSGYHPEKLETEFQMDLPKLEYLQKPYRPAELVASVTALLQRAPQGADQAQA
jgi:two-component system cell cycle sensor histidine kinase/response regulator CckA